MPDLHVRQWTEHHAYSSLDASLNPYDNFKPCSLPQVLHIGGGEDTVVPAAIVQAFSENIISLFC